jgi:Uma2 family endonuclease
MFDEPFGKFILRLGSLKQKISEAEYFEICQLNELLLIERDRNGDWEIRSINGGLDGIRTAALSGKLARCAVENGHGIAFGALTGFRLPNGAVRAPDFAWLEETRWTNLKDNERDRFVPLCPDFIVELQAHHESLEDLQIKMDEFMENGAQLGWLIDPFSRAVYVYRPNLRVEVLTNTDTVSGEPFLTGFVLDLKDIWASNE